MTPDANLPEVIDDELVTDDAPGAALTLFQTSDPRVALERMAAHAKLLVDIVKARRLSQRIGGKEPLLVEAWACLGSCSAFTRSWSGPARRVRRWFPRAGRGTDPRWQDRRCGRGGVLPGRADLVEAGSVCVEVDGADEGDLEGAPRAARRARHLGGLRAHRR